MVNEKDLIEILKRIEQHIATEEDIRIYNSWCNSFQEDSRQHDTSSFEEKKSQLFAAINRKIEARARRINRWLGAAAAVLVLSLLTSVLYQYFNKPLTANPPALASNAIHPIASGINEAMLILADGQRIGLSSRSKGLIATQNGVDIIQLSDSVVAFKARPGAALPAGGQIPGVYLATAKARKFQLILPDGSKVRLNTATAIKFPLTFSGLRQRKVELDGEAYFDVLHDAKHPFVIQTTAGDVKVLGTSFNVKARKNETFETSLIRGKVAVSLKKQGKGDFILKPGQKLVARNIDKTAGAAEIKPLTVKDSLIAETSWTEDRLVFVDKPLVEIAGELERTFDVTIIFQSDKTKQYKYNGIFDDTDWDQILEILYLSKPIVYHRDQKTIYIE